MWELLAQRVSGFVEPHYVGDDMLRGYEDELLARELYSEKIAPVRQMGFITNDKWGFPIGYSPDGLVGDDGLIECKSRRQRFQIETIVNGVMPDDYAIQVQTALLVSERPWCDFVSYSAGHAMAVIRVVANEEIQNAIISAAMAFEARVELMHASYTTRVNNSGGMRLFPTPRKIEMEIPL